MCPTAGVRTQRSRAGSYSVALGTGSGVLAESVGPAALTDDDLHLPLSAVAQLALERETSGGDVDRPHALIDELLLHRACGHADAGPRPPVQRNHPPRPA